jgi:cell division septation protein DedD
MPSQTGRRLRPGGVVRAFIRLLVLVILGFGAGLLIGIVTEEPELLAGHLRGESESIDLATGDSAPADAATPGGFEEAEKARERPSVAASASIASRANNATDAPKAGHLRRSSGSPSGDDGAPVKSAGVWTIQVGAFSDEGAASRLAKSLRAKGYPTKLLSVQGDAGRWRVRVQPMSGENAARETAARLKQVERLPTWILPMETS